MCRNLLKLFQASSLLALSLKRRQYCEGLPTPESYVFPPSRTSITTLGRPLELCSAPPGNGGDQTGRTWMPGAAAGGFATNQGASAGAARSTPSRHSAHGKADEGRGGARDALPTGSCFAAGKPPVNAGTRREVTPPFCIASRPTRSDTLTRPEAPHACRL